MDSNRRLWKVNRAHARFVDDTDRVGVTVRCVQTLSQHKRPHCTRRSHSAHTHAPVPCFGNFEKPCTAETVHKLMIGQFGDVRRDGRDRRGHFRRQFIAHCSWLQNVWSYHALVFARSAALKHSERRS
jgi:hypothetical protein